MILDGCTKIKHVFQEENQCTTALPDLGWCKKNRCYGFYFDFLSSSTIKIANEYDNFVSKLLTFLSTSSIKKKI